MNATEQKLADLVREHPNLYDQSRRDYRNSVKGHLAWKEIGAAMGKSEEEVKLLWKNLRDKFCKARKRLVRRQFPQQDESDIPWEMQVPGLFSQMAWLTAHVKLRAEVGGGMGEPEETSGRADDVEKEQEDDKKRLLDPLPVVTTSFAVAEPTPSSHQLIGPSPKRRRQTTTETEISSADALSNFRDEDELFLLSLLPSLKRLTIKKRMEVRMKFQQVLYAAEFED
ncbi:transcription factor Adf-1-like [Girardinichthys multiradiatus]|uniref:transcription factor Adf-1-like n=1 Tax=Girardinichthys multiradiatus TaxID=208333 RepID=UPI001FADD212|nr:transcription factor Adf-1-like [Girardinichthys multiradiatus]